MQQLGTRRDKFCKPLYQVELRPFVQGLLCPHGACVRALSHIRFNSRVRLQDNGPNFCIKRCDSMIGIFASQSKIRGSYAAFRARKATTFEKDALSSRGTPAEEGIACSDKKISVASVPPAGDAAGGNGCSNGAKGGVTPGSATDPNERPARLCATAACNRRTEFSAC